MGVEIQPPAGPTLVTHEALLQRPFASFLVLCRLFLLLLWTEICYLPGEEPP